MRIVKSVRNRDFEIDLAPKTLDGIQAGTLRTRYKGRRFCKNPFDVVLYMRLIEKMSPKTIIEIGTSEGGSAVWFRDQCRAFGLETTIYTFDIKPPQGFQEPGIVTNYINAKSPEKMVQKSFFENFPKPWLIIEDSAHVYKSTYAILTYFETLVSAGDYIVVEDGVVADLKGEQYDSYKDGPNRAVHDFLETFGVKFEIDTELCDFYGHNLTYCPNAWIKVVEV